MTAGPLGQIRIKNNSVNIRKEGQPCHIQYLKLCYNSVYWRTLLPFSCAATQKIPKEDSV